MGKGNEGDIEEFRLEEEGNNKDELKGRKVE